MCPGLLLFVPVRNNNTCLTKTLLCHKILPDTKDGEKMKMICLKYLNDT